MGECDQQHSECLDRGAAQTEVLAHRAGTYRPAFL